MDLGVGEQSYIIRQAHTARRAQPLPGTSRGHGRTAVSWTDAQRQLLALRRLWLRFGRERGWLNDLWKFDGTNWTWVSGSNTDNQAGVVRHEGVAAPGNVPGRGKRRFLDRSSAATSGSSAALATIRPGTAATSTTCGNSTGRTGPGCRAAIRSIRQASTARRASPLRGTSRGRGRRRFLDRSAAATSGSSAAMASIRPGTVRADLNDLWKFDGTNWTWVSGSNTVNQAGVVRHEGHSRSRERTGGAGRRRFLDRSRRQPLALRRVWLRFGRGTRTTSTTCGNSTGRTGPGCRAAIRSIRQASYGTKGTAAPGNVPGARMTPFPGPIRAATSGSSAVRATIRPGNSLPQRPLEIRRDELDLGLGQQSNVRQAGIYGTKGTADPGTFPGARQSPVSWIDASGNLWLFGGRASILPVVAASVRSMTCGVTRRDMRA